MAHFSYRFHLKLLLAFTFVATLHRQESSAGSQSRVVFELGPCAATLGQRGRAGYCAAHCNKYVRSSAIINIVHHAINAGGMWVLGTILYAIDLALLSTTRLFIVKNLVPTVTAAFD